MWVCSVGGGTEQGERGGVWGVERYMCRGGGGKAMEASRAGKAERGRVSGALGRQCDFSLLRPHYTSLSPSEPPPRPVPSHPVPSRPPTLGGRACGPCARPPPLHLSPPPTTPPHTHHSTPRVYSGFVSP